MARKRRSIDPITMSFLDVISCGFGAVILLFMIMKHNVDVGPPPVTEGLVGEVSLLDEEVKNGKENLVRARNTLNDVDNQLATAKGLASRIQDQLDPLKAELATRELDTTNKSDTVLKLKTEINSLQSQLEKLKDEEAKKSGNNIRSFIGDGNRQYLTGLILGGNRILILVDTSASMLDNTIVNIIRRRNMSDADKLKSPKWTQVRKTIDWLTARLPPPSQYQIYAFNKDVHAVIPGSEGKWLEVADKDQLNKAVETIKNTVPVEGTNMEAVFATVRKLSPPPDNIYLITDGLPTIDSHNNGKGFVSGEERERIFEHAVAELPQGIPVNTILEPLEGDPMASAYFWLLAINTRGSFMTPSSDWP
ncbi:MAG TPA: VWA domain-containing protein [Candidatus Acidoferrum sp.]|nr:VWA domain-containing protein [Candidatus Acidoferrum sp.]